MDPFGELRKNQFSSRHGASLASWLLRKTTKQSLNRSHHFSCACASVCRTYNRQHSPRPDDSDDTYILFVHGYNMENWEKDRFAETAYKRLYWQGYQGRFGSFRWPTYQHFYQYDPSETAAWNSGVGLKRLLTSLHAQYPGNVYVLGRSMGNVVTGEALRLAGTNEIVNTYVASQAAVSARAYDNALPADLTNAFYFHVQTPDSEGHYYTNGASSYFSSIGGAGKFISFFNSQDWALGKWDHCHPVKTC